MLWPAEGTDTRGHQEQGSSEELQGRGQSEEADKIIRKLGQRISGLPDKKFMQTHAFMIWIMFSSCCLLLIFLSQILSISLSKFMSYLYVLLPLFSSLLHTTQQFQKGSWNQVWFLTPWRTDVKKVNWNSWGSILGLSLIICVTLEKWTYLKLSCLIYNMEIKISTYIDVSDE